ncbi:ricin-type beta-trefoil lectin domain protein [Streptomyces sp. NPDC093982]|uniref:RICIN domain-containing protein n=1 Tax=Streptomyces sp. NPDC093982 TaxID=3155077 RepID=UPI00341812C8
MNRRFATLAAASATLLSLTALGAPIAQAEESSRQALSYSYFVNDQDSQQGLAALWGQSAAGTPVMTSNVTGGTDQQWALADRASGTVAIVGLHSGRCIAPTSEHGMISLQDCGRLQFTQRWYEERRPGGRTIFENAYYEGQCLEMAGPNRIATITDCNGSLRQSWKLIAP